MDAISWVDLNDWLLAIISQVDIFYLLALVTSIDNKNLAVKKVYFDETYSTKCINEVNDFIFRLYTPSIFCSLERFEEKKEKIRSVSLSQSMSS